MLNQTKQEGKRMVEYIFKSNGNYLGFLNNGYLFSRDGEYLGWIDSKFVWDSTGQFRGELTEINGKKYILKNIFLIPPIPKIPKFPPVPSILPIPPINAMPIPLPIGFKDAF